MKSIVLAALIAAAVGAVFALATGRWDLALPAVVVGAVIGTLLTLIPSRDHDDERRGDRVAR